MPRSDASGTASSASAAASRSRSGRKQGVAATMAKTYNSMIEESIQEINNILEAEQHKVFPTLRFVKGNIGQDEPEETIGTAQSFPQTYVRISQLPKEFLKNLLPKLEPVVFSDAEFCGQLEKGGKGTLHACLYKGLGVSSTTKWPRLGHSKAVFTAGCVEMYKKRGCRLSTVKFDYNNNGVPYIDWAKPENGVCSLVPDKAGGKLTKVRHCSGKEAPLGEMVNITKDTKYTIVANYLELSAELEIGRHKLGLASFFDHEVSSCFMSVRANESFNSACMKAVAEGAGDNDELPKTTGGEQEEEKEEEEASAGSGAAAKASAKRKASVAPPSVAMSTKRSVRR